VEIDIVEKRHRENYEKSMKKLSCARTGGRLNNAKEESQVNYAMIYL
jgi:hypothetical protein